MRVTMFSEFAKKFFCLVSIATAVSAVSCPVFAKGGGSSGGFSTPVSSGSVPISAKEMSDIIVGTTNDLSKNSTRNFNSLGRADSQNVNIPNIEGTNILNMGGERATLIFGTDDTINLSNGQGTGKTMNMNFSGGVGGASSSGASSSGAGGASSGGKGSSASSSGGASSSSSGLGTGSTSGSGGTGSTSSSGGTGSSSTSGSDTGGMEPLTIMPSFLEKDDFSQVNVRKARIIKRMSEAQIMEDYDLKISGNNLSLAAEVAQNSSPVQSTNSDFAELAPAAGYDRSNPGRHSDRADVSSAMNFLSHY